MQPLSTLMVIWLNGDNATNLLTGLSYTLKLRDRLYQCGKGISVMTQQSVINNWYTILQETEKNLTDPQQTNTYACYVL